MAIDLTKLTPAPWGASGDMVTHPGSEESMRRIKAGEMPFTSIRICICEPSHYLSQEAAEADAEFIALARNALDVFMHRKWELIRYQQADKWCIRYPPMVGDEQAWERFTYWIDDHVWPDPFTALVEADKWYRENCEAKE